MPKRKRIENKTICNTGDTIISYHLENRGTKERKKIRPRAELMDIQRLTPEIQDYTAGKVLEWKIQTGSYAVRFLENCIQMKIEHLVKNSSYTGPNAITENAKREWNGMTPFSAPVANQTMSDRKAYWNLLAGGPASIISEVEIYLDHQLVQAERTGFFSIYNTLNALFLPADKREELLGHPYILHNSNQDGVILGKTRTMTDLLDPSYAYTLNCVDGKKADKPASVILQSDLFGVFPLCKPKNLTLEQILRCPSSGLNQAPLIPPGIEITIRMRLNDPLHYRIIDGGTPDISYFSSDSTRAPNDEQKFKYNDIHLRIKDVSLLIEKIKWDEDRIQRQLSSGTLSYVFDQYIYRARSLNVGTVTTTITDPIPAHTQIVYFAIMYANQLYKDSENTRSSDATRFAIPEKLQKIVFRLNNKVILFENGLSISRDDCHSQPDAGLLYQYMKTRRLTSEPFSTFFPSELKTDSGNIGYKNVIPIDLVPYILTEPSQLTVECTWADGGCPADLYLCLFIPQSVKIERDSKQSAIWKSTAQIS